jgi:4-methyl-5(b-hydroxyethyl)-thiazole monophosphate biosynthesis
MAAANSPPRVLVPIADGSEEMEVKRWEKEERQRGALAMRGKKKKKNPSSTSQPPLSQAVIVIDLLRRAGVAVTVASIEPGRKEVTCSRGVKLVADASIDDAAVKAAEDRWDGVALPGGMPGAERLRDCVPLADAVESARRRGAVWAAICATPAVAWAPRGWLAGKRATGHPAFMDALATAGPGGPAGNATVSEDRVVVDGSLITSRGPGTAFEFGLALVAALCGEAKAAEVAGPLVLPPGK